MNNTDSLPISYFTHDDIHKASMVSFREKVINAPDLMQDLMQALLCSTAGSHFNILEEFFVSENFYDQAGRLTLQTKKLIDLLDFIQACHGSDALHELINHVGFNSGCNLYLLCAMNHQYDHMRLLCQYGCNPCEEYEMQENGQTVSIQNFDAILSQMISHAHLTPVLEVHRELCAAYRKKELEIKLGLEESDSERRPKL